MSLCSGVFFVALPIPSKRFRPMFVWCEPKTRSKQSGVSSQS